MRSRIGRPLPELPEPLAGKLALPGTSLLYLYNPGCGPCRAMTPTVKELASRGERVYPLDISRDASPALALGVLATPTLVVVRDGHIADVIMGAQPPARNEALVMG